MPRLVIRAPRAFEQGFARIRDELDVPRRFPTEVLEAAERARPATAPGDRRDARSIEFVAIDPPGATDLDQLYSAHRRGDGYRVHYAIADVGDFITPGDPIDVEARLRGTTLYSPDTRTPLHPPVLSEDRASLLPGVDRPALLWTIDLGPDGSATAWHLERALVRNREAISYAEVQRRLDGHELGPDDKLSLLAEIGRLRDDREAERGGISINLPAQEVVEHGGTYRLAFDRPLPIEDANAQISLLTGMAAGTTMMDAGTGVLRTLPDPYREDLDKLRLTARALSLDWPDDVAYADFVRTLDGSRPTANAFLIQATRTLRGAGYVGFDGERPDRPSHGAIAAVYAHVTAPLRRLVDRFGNEILLAVFAERPAPTWAVEALDELPSLMGRARQRESALERAILDFAEAVVLEHSVGEVFGGVVVDLDRRRDRARIQIADPAVVASVPDEGRQLAERLTVRLDAVDLDRRTVEFRPL